MQLTSNCFNTGCLAIGNVLALNTEGIKGVALAKEMKISRAAVYKILKEEKQHDTNV
ncbi:helix-turn-helix domain-containing protein [Rickettsia felis]|uniref:helix-turn-helix domain-containing protein n=1 Tax=Rickettsia felis TaxID=42862 RepID=UPI000A7E2A7B|nr:helix-turn-helix domain-containing protein [Rickettsia felis]